MEAVRMNSQLKVFTWFKRNSNMKGNDQASDEKKIVEQYVQYTYTCVHGSVLYIHGHIDKPENLHMV